MISWQIYQFPVVEAFVIVSMNELSALYSRERGPPAKNLRPNFPEKIGQRKSFQIIIDNTIDTTM